MARRARSPWGVARGDRGASVERHTLTESGLGRHTPGRPGAARHPGCHNARAMRLYALRGATTVDVNDAAPILAATTELMQDILERNALTPEDVVSCIFTVTDDLDAAFPATAARNMGFEQVPLICTREIPVPGSLPRVIRVLMHFYADDAHATRHVYLHAARSLRTDLEAAQ